MSDNKSVELAGLLWKMRITLEQLRDTCLKANELTDQVLEIDDAMAHHLEMPQGVKIPADTPEPRHAHEPQPDPGMTPVMAEDLTRDMLESGHDMSPIERWRKAAGGMAKDSADDD